MSLESRTDGWGFWVQENGTRKKSKSDSDGTKMTGFTMWITARVLNPRGDFPSNIYNFHVSKELKKKFTLNT